MRLDEIHWAAIRFLSVPQKERAMTEMEWVTEYLAEPGTPPSTVYERLKSWKKHPDFKAALEESRKNQKSDQSWADRIARDKARDVLMKGLSDKSAKPDERRKAAESVMKHTEALDDETPTSDLSTYSDAELIAMKLGMKVGVLGIEDDELKEILTAIAHDESTPESTQEERDDTSVRASEDSGHEGGADTPSERPAQDGDSGEGSDGP